MMASYGPDLKRLHFLGSIKALAHWNSSWQPCTIISGTFARQEDKHRGEHPCL